ncbi:MAG: sigma-70 family RNA polymerase sigma factor [Anaerolineae bacterium]|nr:sigma-70 family RNA polymerase sigma factor [Anaerolineae bacterium]
MMIAAADERELVVRAQQGERQAFSDLVSTYRQGVIRVVYNICGDGYQAEDIAQEAFIRAWQKLPGYRPKASFRSWLYRIATNAALDAQRKAKPTIDLDTVQVADPSKGLEAGLVHRQRAERIQQAILALPAASRSVLVLREYENLSYQEISDTLEIPVGTVMSRLNYARSKMRESLADMLEAV